ncbi:MAG TPA: sulfate adenylyltransferase subunit CysN, partial [Sphingomicrobium sp.]|nr:sulfate adenylyltransferase subunit CysN [Sphingomicrobium sp.]
MARVLEHDRDLIARDVGEWLARHERKEMLRFITCGSVDDGKSTLIGRLLYDCRQVFDDQLETLEAESKKAGGKGKLDFALLVDGLSAEREQGITIDVAYRFFASDKRKFIVADTPGHEQYTRNMITGASTADVAVLLIDARKGVLTQTRRHSYLAHLVGIRHVLLAVTKMDLVGYDQEAFDAICSDYRRFAEKIGIEGWQAIPVSGAEGANVISRSEATPWYSGPTLLDYLDTVEIDASADAAKPLRMPVQWVNRPDQGFRGFAGQIASGRMGPGTEIRILPSGRTTRIARVVTFDGDLDEAVAGQSVTVTLEDEVDCSRGDVIAAAAEPPEAADQFEATVVWMSEDELLPGRGYWMKIGTETVTATVHEPKYEVNVNTLDHLAAKTLGLNSIGVAEISTDREIVFEPYDSPGTSSNRVLGGFILIDKVTNATVA